MCPSDRTERRVFERRIGELRFVLIFDVTVDDTTDFIPPVVFPDVVSVL